MSHFTETGHINWFPDKNSISYTVCGLRCLEFSLQVNKTSIHTESKTEKMSSGQKQTEGHLIETNKSKPQVTVRALFQLLPHFSSPCFCSDCDQPADKFEWSYAWRGKSCAGVAQSKHRNSSTEGFVVCLELRVYRHIKTAWPLWNEQCCFQKKKDSNAELRVQQRADPLRLFHHVLSYKQKIT